MHGMIAWFARNEVAANLLMVAIVALGAWSLFDRIPLEVFPEFEPNRVTISMAYRGATPAEVESALVVRIEEAIANLDGIDDITSNALEGLARVRVALVPGSDARDLLDDIKTRVDAISTFPDGVERPEYSVVLFRGAVIDVVVSANLPELQLRTLGQRVRDELVALPELSLAELHAVRQPEIAIEVSEEALDRYQLTFDAIVQAVRRSSVDQPAGSIRTQGGEILLRTRGQAYRAADFARIPVRTRSDGTRLSVGDVAVVRDGFEEMPMSATFNGRRSVIIEVFRTGAQSALAIGQAVKDYMVSARARLPEGVMINESHDRSRIVKSRLKTLLTSAWQGGLLVFLILALFLRFSVALWVCVGIPISFMGALILMPTLGVTINIISLFAFILVLGIVVDDAIVTGENIYRHLRRGEDPGTAVVLGTKEVAVPVTFGVLTTVAAFLPLLFMGGYRGPIFAAIPLVVIPVLLFSWVESKLILPAHMRHVRLSSGAGSGAQAGVPQIPRHERMQHYVADGLEHGIEQLYRPVLEWVIARRYLTLALFTALSIIILSIALSGRYGFTFFPRVQSETARATLVMQAGTAAEETARHLARMEKAAEVLQARYTDGQGRSLIRNIMVSTGWVAGFGSPATVGSSDVGQVSLELIPPEERTLAISTSALVAEWRRAIGPVPGARELTYRAEIGRGGDPVDVQLSGQDFDELATVARAVRARLAEYPGLFDIHDSFDNGKPEIELSMRPEAELLGLSAADLGKQVRQAFLGAEAQHIQRGRDDVRVMVRYPEGDRRHLDRLDTMRIRNDAGIVVPFGNVAQLEMGQGLSTIRRVDRQRVIDVTADLDKKQTDVRQITADLKAFLDDLLLRHPDIRYSLSGEQKERRESFHSLFLGVAFSLFAIYALLAIPFRSYTQPLVVMLVIPFSTVGALLGHMVMGMNLSLMSLMGMLALVGVVVNDSLVLVDWINRRRAEGMALADAVRKAGVARFRPILLTSLTTFAGLTPLLLEKSTQAQFLIPMAVSLGFGILFATVLTLVLVPVGYMILNDGLVLFGRLYGKGIRA